MLYLFDGFVNTKIKKSHIFYENVWHNGKIPVPVTFAERQNGYYNIINGLIGCFFVDRREKR